MNEIAIRNAATFAEQKQLELRARLGFGIHGVVYLAKNNLNRNYSAVKAHSDHAPWLRERLVYERLHSVSVRQILGFNVPQLISIDPQLQIIEMTVVKRPFVLDFAGAYLDVFPDFSDEVWDEWEVEKHEQFGNDWPLVQQVIAAFERLDIHLIDVTPRNISLRD
jgi:hypothetical protein